MTMQHSNDTALDLEEDDGIAPVTEIGDYRESPKIPTRDFTELSSTALNIMSSLAGSRLRVNDPGTLDDAYKLIDAMSQDAKECVLAHYHFLDDMYEEVARGRL